MRTGSSAVLVFATIVAVSVGGCSGGKEAAAPAASAAAIRAIELGTPQADVVRQLGTGRCDTHLGITACEYRLAGDSTAIVSYEDGKVICVTLDGEELRCTGGEESSAGSSGS